jgi:hypothetical protein
MQPVKVFQVGDGSDSQEIETLPAGLLKIADIAKEVGTPRVVLTDTGVDQQVVPPGERTRAFRSWASHMAPPKKQERPELFRSADLIDEMAFAESCGYALGWCRLNGEVGARKPEVLPACQMHVLCADKRRR